MKSSETDILFVQGHGGSGPGHWQSRVAAKLKTARIVTQADLKYPNLNNAIHDIVQAVHEAERPIVFVCHGTGSIVLAHAMPALSAKAMVSGLRGAYFVAPPSAAALRMMAGIDPDIANIPREPMPFPSLLVASSNDPFATLEESADLALAWGSEMVEAGEAGHINEESGHGPWPEGLMRFAGFLSKLS